MKKRHSLKLNNLFYRFSLMGLCNICDRFISLCRRYMSDFFIFQEEVKLYAEDGSVDINGNPPLKQKTGNWKACPFIFGINQF